MDQRDRLGGDRRRQVDGDGRDPLGGVGGPERNEQSQRKQARRRERRWMIVSDLPTPFSCGSAYIGQPAPEGSGRLQ